MKAENTRDATPAVVIDTSIFVNPDTQRLLGSGVNAAVRAFIRLAREQNLRVYVPVSIFRELSHFVDQDALDDLRAHAIVRAPDIFGLTIPAAVLHFFIRDIRQRIDRGLRVAEQAARSENSAETVRRLREKYREVVRSGIVDSVEDLDVILLAKETGAAILTADEGIRSMAQVLGIETFTMRDFLVKYGSSHG